MSLFFVLLCIDIVLGSQIFFLVLWMMYSTYLAFIIFSNRMVSSDASLTKFTRYTAIFLIGSMILYCLHNIMLLITLFVEFLSHEVVSESVSKILNIITSSCSFLGSVSYIISIGIASQYTLNLESLSNSISIPKCVFICQYIICGCVIISWTTLLGVYPHDMNLIIFIHRFGFFIISGAFTITYFCRTRKLSSNRTTLSNQLLFAVNRPRQVKQISYTLYAVQSLFSLFSITSFNAILGETGVGHKVSIFITGFCYNVAIYAIYIALQENLDKFKKHCKFMCNCCPCLKSYCETYWANCDDIPLNLTAHQSDNLETGNNSPQDQDIPEVSEDQTVEIEMYPISTN
mmetsp:Transcript_52417/g.47058  ORF Transcript_52417/g.47058 Transcript_52417/m.47058 type:complete len:346 (-) Transcript_52417:134-1171(-)